MIRKSNGVPICVLWPTEWSWEHLTWKQKWRSPSPRRRLECGCVLNLPGKGGCESDVSWLWLEASLPCNAGESATESKGRGSRCSPFFPLSSVWIRDAPRTNGTCSPPIPVTSLILVSSHWSQVPKKRQEVCICEWGLLSPAGCVHEITAYLLFDTIESILGLHISGWLC